jgi:two-component system, sensor histidine kinase
MSNQPVVLYVEDEVRSRKVMRMMTAEMGLSDVVIFEDSADFMDRVEALEPQPNVIFLDIHVPPYNGFEMLKMLRDSGRYERTPIVAMTASVMNEEIQQLIAVGFNGCLAKPIDIDTFPAIFDRIVNGEEIWSIEG